MIDVACNIDNNYIQQCCTMLTSLFVNNIDAPIRVHVISEGLSEEGKQRIQQVASRYPKATVCFHRIKKELLNGFSVLASSHITIATYYRLFVAEILPTDIDKLLYLDCDLVVNGPIDALWDIDLQDKAVGAVEDMWSGKADNYERLGYPSADSYFNAGVLLINLRWWRENQLATRASQYIHAHHDALVFYDQDVLNALLHDHKRFVPFRYNVQDGFLRRRRKIREEVISQLDNELHHPVILHFTGSKKPWHYNCLNPFRQLYFDYLDLTSFKGQRPTVPFAYRMKRLLDALLFALHLKTRRYRSKSISFPTSP